ncbi:MAG TPA: flagellar biosynthesis protein FlhB [Caulobacteraceae bacterium]|nr:flagellar biosynthesis protein FlhB [Caulobacteraceae bacterium]
MAEQNDSATKTEEATPRKLEEARKRGEVAKSVDVPAFASLAAAVGFIAVGGGFLARNLAERLQPFIAHADAYDLSGGGGVALLHQAAMAAAPIVLGVMFAAGLAGVGGNLIQHGFLLTTERLKPDTSRISPMSGFQRLFGIDGLAQFVKSMLKIGLIACVAYTAVRPHWSELQRAVDLDPVSGLVLAGDALRALFISVLAVLGIVAALDWLWQRQRFLTRMRMSREELKEDYRQSEGDPHVRARLRQIRYERARRRMMQNVPKATVVVTNPDHFAVALRYQQGETAAPVCVAKGQDQIALRIKAVAEENRVPIVEDPPLARALYATVEIDETIPRQHYEAVAKVIGFVMRQAQRRRARL